MPTETVESGWNATRPHSHAREKLLEAVSCLVASKPFGVRMTKAAEALGKIHSDELVRLPKDVRNKLDAVMADLTKHPGEWKGGYAASVRRLGHRRRTEIVEDILGCFVTLSGGL
jgi:hypothetical protein